LATKANCLEIEGSSSAATVRRAILGSLLILGRQKKTWSPTLLAGVSWRALTNIRTRPEIHRLLSLPPYTEYAQSNPRFAWKYLTRGYLVRGLTTVERASCFVHHYERLRSALPEHLLRQILQREEIGLKIPEGANRFTLTMGLPNSIDQEGEMSINFRVDGEIVFLLSFAIVPGWIVKSKSPEVLLITHLQGIRGTYRQIYLATRSLHEVAPGAILLAAVQGVAMALGIGQLAAVCATRQFSYDEDFAANFERSYDQFFAELGMARNDAGFFSSPVPMPEKHIAFIKQGHKIRTKEKRAFKQRIQSACAGLFASVNA
jgi:uncharacterized protein VirK/YbjX